MSLRWILAAATASTACQSGLEVTQQMADDVATAPKACNYPQIYGTADHGGVACPELRGMRKVAEIVQDRDWAAEVDFNGFLQVHEGAPLTQGDWVVVPYKDGYTDSFNEQTVRYHVRAFRWSPTVTASDAVLGLDPTEPGGERRANWSFDSDFATVDANVCSFGCMTNGYVQAFNVAISGGWVYVPGASGTFTRLRLSDGEVMATIDPFVGTAVDGDSRLITNNAPMVSADGSVFYTVTAWPLGSTPFGRQPRGSWLVRLSPSDAFKVVDWSPDNAVKIAGSGVASAALGIPAAADQTCEVAFRSRGTPGPTGPDSRPRLGICGAQRPALNAPLAHSSATNRLVGYSYSNNSLGVAFLIEIDPDTLTPIVAADLRNNRMRYGCGVRLDVATFPDCDVLTAHGTVNIGAHPETNGDLHFRTPADIMDNAPTISPDGQLWTIGSYDGGFSFEGAFFPPAGYDARGSMVEFNSDGSFHANNPDFGWEVTESAMPLFPTGQTSTIQVGFDWLQDRGLYSLGHLGLAMYSSDMQLQNVGELPNVLFGDFVDVNVSYGRRRDHYGVSENGFAYKLDADGHVADLVQLTDEPIEVLSGVQSVDLAGRRYFSYAGRVHVVASDEGDAVPLSVKLLSAPAPRPGQRAALKAALAAPDPAPVN